MTLAIKRFSVIPMSDTDIFCWPSPWGFEENSPPPAKRELFPDDGRPLTWGIEDFLQHNNVFRNGITGRPCHSDSYMTILDYESSEKCVALLEETLKPDKKDWQSLVTSWLGSPNTQPPLRLFALLLVAKFQLVKTEIDPSQWS